MMQPLLSKHSLTCLFLLIFLESLGHAWKTATFTHITSRLAPKQYSNNRVFISRKTNLCMSTINNIVLVPVKPNAHDIYTGRDPARVKIFDTTLRDGEQSPGCTMNTEEKLAVARQLSKLGVDIIEAGFPVSSPGDFEAVNKIAIEVGNTDDPPVICGLARSVKNDIKICWDAVKPAKFPRIHVFIATSDIHMEYKLKKTRAEVIEITKEMVTYAKSLCEDIEFSAEDALRSDPAFLYEVYSVAIAAGATTINVPDTVGYTTPGEFKTLIQGIRGNVVGVDDVTISVHGHNDLGMAVANFLAAVEGGARQLECTINGIGERAGNAALEELAMGLHVRKSYYNRFFGRAEDSETPLTNINSQEISKSSRLVSSITGMLVQANKAIVGANAFAHESGIHQDGVLKNKRTYEIMDAESIGLSGDNIVLGKHSGRAAFRSRLSDLGFILNDQDLNSAFVKFKELADKKKVIENADLEFLVNDEIHYGVHASADTKPRYKLTTVQVQCGNKQIPTATVTVLDEETGIEHLISCTGTGPVDATFKAIATLTASGMPIAELKLLEYTVSSVTAGIDALGEVSVRLQDESCSRIATGRSANTDVIYASAKAYINAINRLVSLRGEALPKHPQFSSAVY